MARWPGGESHLRLGHAIEEGLELGRKALPQRPVARDIGDHSRPIDDRQTDRFEPCGNSRPVAIDLGRKFPQEEEVADAAQLLGNPIGFVEVSLDPHADQAVAHAGKPAFKARFLLQHHLPDALLVVEPRGQQHIGDDGEQFRGLSRHGFAAQEQPGRCLAGTQCRRDEAIAADTAGRPADALRQRNEILGFGAGLQQGPAENRQIRQ